ncbi:MAG: SDR family NAD(P)-dependent oxidoreductase [Planctomycetota bacterium]|jgi:3-oxoacyl-[acyl-carrier protein] reductase
MDTRIDNKIALVTGASRGLGASMARKLAAAGARVAVNYNGSKNLAESVCQQITDAGGQAKAFQANVTDEDEVGRLISEVEATFGGTIEILVINATGPQPFISIEDMTWRDCLDQLEFFVKSPLLLVKAVVGAMKKNQYGRIINIGSEVLEKGVPRFANYVSAKGAQLGLSRSWAMELAEHQITVNHVAPGWIPTERHADDPQEMKDEYAALVPMKHMGEPDDIGNIVAYLASDAAKFITGQKISVNGGNSLE